MKKMLFLLLLLSGALVTGLRANTMQFLTRTTVTINSSTATAWSPSTTAKTVLGYPWPGSFTVLHSALSGTAYTYDFDKTATWTGPFAPGLIASTSTNGLDRVGGGTSMFFQAGAGTVYLKVTLFGEK